MSSSEVKLARRDACIEGELHLLPERVEPVALDRVNHTHEQPASRERFLARVAHVL